MSKHTVIDGTDYGPLACLVGTWAGQKGNDLAPEPDGEENTPYSETLTFEAIGDVTNAEKQTLAVLRYHQVVSRLPDNCPIHNETGYWHWDAETGIVMQTLAIPRGVCLLAGGKVDNNTSGQETVIEVVATDGDPEWGITQSPFMQQKARTLSFYHKLTVKDDQLSYTETTVVDIYGKRFNHVDSNILTR